MKRRCDNCPARNQRVSVITVARTKERMLLCPLCRAALERVEAAIAEANRALAAGPEVGE